MIYYGYSVRKMLLSHLILRVPLQCRVQPNVAVEQLVSAVCSLMKIAANSQRAQLL